jgi:hypothetical protein
MTGIEPAWPAWKAGALPLSYIRVPRRTGQRASHVAYRLPPVSRTPGHGPPKAKIPTPYLERSRVPPPPSASPHRRDACTALWHAQPPPCSAPPDDPQDGAQIAIVRLADKRPNHARSGLQVPLAPAPRAGLAVLTWPVISASQCHVRMPDITGQSHLRPAPRLALDTCRRNGHASDQAQ